MFVTRGRGVSPGDGAPCGRPRTDSSSRDSPGQKRSRPPAPHPSVTYQGQLQNDRQRPRSVEARRRPREEKKVGDTEERDQGGAVPPAPRRLTSEGRGAWGAEADVQTAPPGTTAPRRRVHPGPGPTLTWIPSRPALSTTRSFHFRVIRFDRTGPKKKKQVS